LPKPSKLVVGVFAYDFFPLVGGQGRHVYELYRESRSDEGITLRVFSPRSNALEDHVQVHPRTVAGLKNMALSALLVRDLPRLIREHGLDLVHLHGGPGGLLLPRKLPVPTVFTCHHTYVQEARHVPRAAWKIGLAPLERRSYALADRTIAVSESTKRVLTGTYRLAGERVAVIPNGVTASFLRAPAPRTAVANEILYVGRLDRRKGIDYLLRSMTVVGRRAPQIRLHVVGEGGLLPWLEEFKRRHRLNVVLHGRLSDQKLEELYGLVAVQLVPSAFEGFGISVLEGMAHGVPVIGTDTDGIRDIIHDSENGLLVLYGDEEALAEAILRLCEDPREGEVLAERAAQRLDGFGWRAAYDATVRLYRELAS
jgi:glycosyltransferase involved in cell wall biosynthesis